MPPVHQPVVVVGDWNDVEAAVLVGAGHADMALVGPAKSQNPDLEQRFEVITATDEPLTLVARRDATASTSQPISLSVETRYGFNRERISALLFTVSRRLRQLAGVDSAPVP